MTHLNGDFLVVKDHPRIIFRGKLDTLESELILCQLTDKGLEAPVGEILELARRIIRCGAGRAAAMGQTLRPDGG